jgi:hypothetical protein
MTRTKVLILAAIAVVAGVLARGLMVRADEFKKEDLERWEKEFMTVVKAGR